MESSDHPEGILRGDIAQHDSDRENNKLLTARKHKSLLNNTTRTNLIVCEQGARIGEDKNTLTAVLVVLEDFAHVACVYKAKELLGKRWK